MLLYIILCKGFCMNWNDGNRHFAKANIEEIRNYVQPAIRWREGRFAPSVAKAEAMVMWTKVVGKTCCNDMTIRIL